MPLIERLDAEERARLRRLAVRFLRAKRVEVGGHGEVSDEMRGTIATVGCVPVLNLGLDWYRGWTSVIVYPNAFMARHEVEDECGIVHVVSRPLSGEAWHQGPVIVSWDDLRTELGGAAWGNVLIHELAHKLDLLNGEANGMPPLHRNMERRHWTGALTDAFADLQHRLERGFPVPLDESAAEDPGEFFAIVSEAFFTDPQPLLRSYPAVYGQLAAFYRQDPVRACS